MNFIIAPEAAKDLTEIYDYIARDSPGAASRVIDRLYARFQWLADGQVRGAEVRLRGGGQAQGWSSRPYKIYYRHVADQTHILRVYHQARRPIER